MSEGLPIRPRNIFDRQNELARQRYASTSSSSSEDEGEGPPGPPGTGSGPPPPPGPRPDDVGDSEEGGDGSSGPPTEPPPSSVGPGSGSGPPPPPGPRPGDDADSGDEGGGGDDGMGGGGVRAAAGADSDLPTTGGIEAEGEPRREELAPDVESMVMNPANGNDHTAEREVGLEEAGADGRRYTLGSWNPTREELANLRRERLAKEKYGLPYATLGPSEKRTVDSIIYLPDQDGTLVQQHLMMHATVPTTDGVETEGESRREGSGPDVESIVIDNDDHISEGEVDQPSEEAGTDDRPYNTLDHRDRLAKQRREKLAKDIRERLAKETFGIPYTSLGPSDKRTVDGNEYLPGWTARRRGQTFVQEHLLMRY